METDRLMEGDRRTAGLVKDLANTICPYLQMEADFPSNHSSGWMPLLDLQVQIARDNSINYQAGVPQSAPGPTNGGVSSNNEAIWLS